MNKVDAAAYYLFSYTGTLSYDGWRKTVVETVEALAATEGLASAHTTVQEMAAFYCVDVAPGKAGRAASTTFKSVHRWESFRADKALWLDEWRAHRKRDLAVVSLRAKCLQVPSVDPREVHDDPLGRMALTQIMEEAKRRQAFDRRADDGALSFLEQQARVSIAAFGGEPYVLLYDAGRLADRHAVPMLTTMCFVDRLLAETIGETAVKLKQERGR